MINTDEDALVCDLAETYHILDYKRLPLTTVAVFASGLRDDSRIMMRMSEQSVTTDTLLMAQITDAVSLLLWSKTEDGQAGNNRPNSIVSALLGTTTQKQVDQVTFSSGEDFIKARQKLMEGGAVIGN
ncbi:DUF5361 domain-containing protein [Lacticaseibacillus parakribbianus]|uniref:DUF5361 domain-containing protein n=1 Tax=Lacticaseibacillus parakribbianus TaxID=2970927 RepID=UPI0021CB8578|nr:DUF5361 domain-containing protein [Lacticaseibacillus parakribbianus]